MIDVTKAYHVTHLKCDGWTLCLGVVVLPHPTLLRFLEDSLYINKSTSSVTTDDASVRRVVTLGVLITSLTTCQDVVDLLCNFLFVVDLLYLLYNKSTTNRTNRVWA